MARLQQELASAKRILIGTHLNPDGDALGSSLALSLYLDGLNIENEVLCHHPAPKNLRFLPGVSRIRQHPKEGEVNLGFLLDLDSWDRLGDVEPHFRSIPWLIQIDHHVPHDEPGNLRIVDTTAPATAVILFRILEELGASLTPAMATCLLVGIVTDTGSFRFRNTTPEALSIASKLLDAGADIELISEQVFQNKPLAAARLLGYTLGSMVLIENDQIAYAVIPNDLFAQTGASDEDTEGFVNELLSIETVKIAALARESRPGKYRVSIRSRGTLDVASVARLFNGGGHRNAAGCTLSDDLEGELSRLVSLLSQCLESS